MSRGTLVLSLCCELGLVPWLRSQAGFQIGDKCLGKLALSLLARQLEFPFIWPHAREALTAQVREALTAQVRAYYYYYLLVLIIVNNKLLYMYHIKI